MLKCSPQDRFLSLSCSRSAVACLHAALMEAALEDCQGAHVALRGQSTTTASVLSDTVSQRDALLTEELDEQPETALRGWE